MTNGDRIRAMSDEELAFYLLCPKRNDEGSLECHKDGCKPCCLEWLQQPAEGSGE